MLISNVIIFLNQWMKKAEATEIVDALSCRTCSSLSGNTGLHWKLKVFQKACFKGCVAPLMCFPLL